MQLAPSWPAWEGTGAANSSVQGSCPVPRAGAWAVGHAGGGPAEHGWAVRGTETCDSHRAACPHRPERVPARPALLVWRALSTALSVSFSACFVSAFIFLLLLDM